MAEVKPRIRLDKKDVKRGDPVEVKTLVSAAAGASQPRLFNE